MLLDMRMSYCGRSRVLADILYKTATTTTAGLRYLTDLGKTPKENGALFSGQGVKPNGVDQTITVPINDTIGSFVKTVDGVQTITDDFGAITDLVISSNNTHQDYYLFTRNLTASEKSLAQNNAEDFMIFAKNDASCVFASTCVMDAIGNITNQVDSVDYLLTNYLVSSNITQLQTGSQRILYDYDITGKIITGKSDALEFGNSGDGYTSTGIIPDFTKNITMEFVGDFKNNGLDENLGSSIFRFRKLTNGYIYFFGKTHRALTTFVEAKTHIMATLLQDGSVELLVNNVPITPSVFASTDYSFPILLGGYNEATAIPIAGRYWQTPIPYVAFYYNMTSEDKTKAYEKALAGGYLDA